MNDLSIRELVGAKLRPYFPLLAEIECGSHFQENNPEHRAWLERKIEQRLSCGARFFGSEDESGQPTGVLGVAIERQLHCAPTAEVVDVGVVRGQRRTGLGSQLLDYAETHARESQAHSLYARTYAGDAGTIAFYGRCGFSPVAVVPGKNGPDDEGEIVLRKRLT
jgi:GNAT superfamily N-acetyltransferase